MNLFNFTKKQDEEESSNSYAEEKNYMIKGIENLSETSVKEVMIPRIDADFIPIDTPEEELIKIIAESGHSRFPVHKDSLDNILGILYVKDLIVLLSKKEKINLEKVIRKPYFVPETKKIDSLLHDFRHKHLHIAVVVDEYGGTSGIVCMEDIIEKIVGDIKDEFDEEEDGISSIGNGIWLCDARVSLEELGKTLGEDFPTEDFDTTGGFVLDLFGKIPIKYERKIWKDFEFIIQEIDGHRINLIKIIKIHSGEEEISEVS